MIRVLFVCMGNICRSPTAHGLFAQLVKEQNLGDRIVVDSAGTHAYHIGNSPDRRSQEAALRRGIDLSTLRARRVEAADFAAFDYVLAMDDENYQILARLCPPEAKAKLQLFLDYAPHLAEREVPDPYYGGEQGFERVLDMIDAASQGLLAHIRTRHL